MHGFRSDNNAGLCPEAVRAILDANDGHRFAYGDDVYTQEAVGRIRDIFGDGTAAWFVATGTAAGAAVTGVGATHGRSGSSPVTILVSVSGGMGFSRYSSAPC